MPERIIPVCEQFSPNIYSAWAQNNFISDFQNGKRFPQFNPNNSFELLFASQEDAYGRSKLWKYNLVTKSKDLIYHGSVVFQPSWGRNGWILLNHLRGDVSKIKDNGDSLTLIRNSLLDWHPKWDYEGKNFIVMNDSSGTYRIILANSDGIGIDTFNYGFTPGSSWDHPQYIATVSRDNLSILDPLNNDLEYLYRFDRIGGGEGAIWLKDQETIVWANRNGLHRTNIRTKVTRQIEETCKISRYLYGTYSSGLDKMVWQKSGSIRSEDDPQTIIVSHSLIMMDPDGSNQEVLNIE